MRHWVTCEWKLKLQLLNALYCTADLAENKKKKKQEKTARPSETEIGEEHCLLGNFARGVWTVQEICYILLKMVNCSRDYSQKQLKFS